MDLARSGTMRETRISVVELGLMGATRALLGLGVGILIARHIARDRHSAVGGTLVILGALSTIPFAIRLLKRRRVSNGADVAARPSVAT